MDSVSNVTNQAASDTVTSPPASVPVKRRPASDTLVTRITRIIYLALAAAFCPWWSKFGLSTPVELSRHQDQWLAFALLAFGTFVPQSPKLLLTVLLAISYFSLHSPVLSFFFLVAVVVSKEST